MAGGPFLQPKALEHLSDGELRAYFDHCRHQVTLAEERLLYLQGRLDEASSDVRKDGILTFGGAVLSAAGMVGIAFFTPAGLVALAGGAFSLVSLEGFGSKARKRNLLRIDVRDLNESILFCTAELERISLELQRRAS